MRSPGHQLDPVPLGCREVLRSHPTLNVGEFGSLLAVPTRPFLPGAPATYCRQVVGSGQVSII
eukprot:1651019-Pyramimonas_sp.AAC.1